MKATTAALLLSFAVAASAAPPPLQPVLDINRTLSVPGNAPKPVTVNGVTLTAFCVNSTYYAYSCPPWVTDGTDAGTHLLSSKIRYIGSDFVAVGNAAYFFGTDINYSTALYRTDGTAAGTTSLTSIYPYVSQLAGTSQYLFYAAGDTVWRTDGTAPGTIKLADLFSPSSFVAVGNVVYFAASGGVWGRELWRSDGTSAGTYIVHDIIPGVDSSGPSQPAKVGTRLFFWARATTLSATTLWVTDGSDAGTVQASSISPDSAGPIADLNGNALFTARAANGSYSLVQSDGTPAGTVVLRTFAGTDLQKPVVAGGFAYFLAADSGSLALWRTDGTAPGTMLATPASFTNASNIVAVGTSIYFRASPGTGSPTGLYRTDGTPAGTVAVTDTGTPVAQLAGQLLSATGIAWMNDGTPSGARALRSAPGEPTGNSYCIDGYAVLAGVAYFAANDGEHGCELWRSDGTAAGTWLVNDAVAGEASAFPTCCSGAPAVPFLASGSYVFYIASNGLWRTDGTPAGTLKLSSDSTITNLITSGNSVYYFTSVGSTTTLWKSDGNVAGTVQLRAFPYDPNGNILAGSLVAVPGGVMFGAGYTSYYYPTQASSTLYRSDGTPAGTVAVTTLPGAFAATQMLAANGQVFFGAIVSSNGPAQLWSTDGTAAGTHRVPGNGTDGVPFGSFLPSFGKYVAFNAPYPNPGIWVSDGTVLGTRTIWNGYSATTAVAAGNFLYYAVGTYPNSLRRTDGVNDALLTTSADQITGLTAAGSSVYFLGYDYTNGRQLWKATPTSAAIVASAAPNNLSDSLTAAPFAVLGNGLLLFGNSATNGIEPLIYAFDGTADAMTFASVSGAAWGTVLVSSPAAVTGINTSTNAIASNGQVCTSSANNCGCDLAPFGATAPVDAGNYVCLRQSTPYAGSATTTTSLSIGATVATFTSTTGPAVHLVVAKVGTGQGRVASSNSGIDCGSSCATDFPFGATVTLNAAAHLGSAFQGWSGSCSGRAACTLTLSGDTTVTANFGPSARRGLARDVDGDSMADLLWRNANGGLATWMMNGATYRAIAMLNPPTAGGNIYLTGDFNGDGRTDILWRDASGRYDVTLMDSGVVIGSAMLLAGGSGWEVVAKGDFDGDGRTDLIWKAASGEHRVALMNGTSGTGYVSMTLPGAGATVALVADFNGDGKSDIVWTRPDGSSDMTLMNGLQPVAPVALLGGGTGWTPAFFGDFDGDGNADLVWRHADGRHGIWFMHGTTPWTYSTLVDAGTGWNVRFVRDLDGDGMSDIIWSQDDGSYALWLMAGGAAKNYKIVLGAGTGWNVVASEDFDGDGKDDLLWRSNSGAYSLWLMDGLNAKAYGSLTSGGSGWEVLP